MIHLRFNENCAPTYMTLHAAAADLHARQGYVINSNEHAKIPTGVWIAGVDWDKVPPGFIPEIQIRARSGLAYKYGICLSNGIGTIDADYPDEICVLLYNTGKTSFEVKPGDRIAQMVINLVSRFSELPIGEKRSGGFGSTG